MTKQELLNGKKFSLGSSTTMYKLETMDNKYYSVSRLSYSRDGELLFTDYEANIDNVGSKYFSFYNFIMGKEVRGKINFLNL